MTPYRKLSRGTQPWLLASAVGLSGVPPMCVEAGLPFLSGSTPSVASQEPALLPGQATSARPIPDSSQPLLLTSGHQAPPKTEVQRQLEMLYEQNGREMPQMVDPGFRPNPQPQTQQNRSQDSDTDRPQLTAGSAETSGPKGVLGKFSDMFRKPKAPSSPPEDPGLNYPVNSGTANRRQPQAPPAVPPATATEIPSVPPMVQRGQAKIPVAPQPNMFQAPQAANPIHSPATTASAQPKNVSGLREILEEEEQTVATPALAAPAAADKSLPVLSLSAPALAPPPAEMLPAPAEPRKDPAEPKDLVAIPPAPGDPLNNLFPEDADADAPDIEVGRAMVPDTVVATPAETQPYTGLTLDDLPAVPQSAAKSNPPLQVASRDPDASLSLPLPPVTSAPQPDAQTKLQKIASRRDRSGLKGFCPVVLQDQRDLVDTDENFSAIYNGKRYEFSSEVAMEQFLQQPQKYAPANSGHDVIHLALTGESREGSLEFAVWYKGRLYLFQSAETMETFVSAPSSHAVLE